MSRDEAEARSRELYPDVSPIMPDRVTQHQSIKLAAIQDSINMQRRAYLKCWDDMRDRSL